MRHPADPSELRRGLLADRRDCWLLLLAIVAATIDFAGVSWWTGGAKPFGDEQRWLTVLLQAAYIAANASRVGGLVRACPAFLALVAFCAASAAWSVSPATSILGAVRLLLLGACIVLGQERHGGGLLRRIFLATLVALVIANLAMLAIPSRSIMDGTLAGAFRGLTDHKNTLGQVCALALAFVLAAWPETAERRPALLLAAALVLATVALTRSATAAVLSATAIGVFATEGFVHRCRLPLLASLVLASAAAALGLLALTGLLHPLAAVGRDPTLTGRSDIWAFVDAYVRERPWLGFGYRAFPLADLLRADPRWGGDSYIVGTTHNAYVAIVSELGYVGLSAYAAWVVALVAGGFLRGDRAGRLCATMVLGVYLVSGLTESFAGLAPGLYLAGLLIAIPPAGGGTRRLNPLLSSAGYAERKRSRPVARTM
ncbi:MAG: O-antigen ligase family protein [Amaricoccus sp.]